MPIVSPFILVAVVLLSGTVSPQRADSDEKAPIADGSKDYTAFVQPLLKAYCLDCHSTKAKKGELDLERFGTLSAVRSDLKPWQLMIEQLETNEMPPKDRKQPTADERKRLVAWTRAFLDAEVVRDAGDPGAAPLRRLSNAEYNATVRDLTGVDFMPAREFPADGAAGEGFTNAAEALSMSPTLMTKFLNAAKEISDHVVLLPDGFRFSPAKTRRDWTNECLAQLRQLYGEYTSDGRLPLKPYLTATIKYRDDLKTGKTTIETVATQEKLSPKYLQILWRTFTDATPSYPLDKLRETWNEASEKQVDALIGVIGAWQTAIWKFVPIGSYRNHQTIRQMANDPLAVETQPVRLALKPEANQNEVVLYLTAREIGGEGIKDHVIWRRPRFEMAKSTPILLSDYRRLEAGAFAEAAKTIEFLGQAFPMFRLGAFHHEIKHGLDASSFGTQVGGKAIESTDLVAPIGSVLEIHLPAAFCRDREFVVEGQASDADAVVQLEVSTRAPSRHVALDGKSPVVANKDGQAYKQLLRGLNDFRACFPQFICYPNIVPVDEVVCLKLYHREDELLSRLFLDDRQAEKLERLWMELRFISQWPITEQKNLPLFIGFVTQDQPVSSRIFYEGMIEPFRIRALEFEKETEGAIPKQLDALLNFAARAYRRPLTAGEKTQLLGLYESLRQKGVSHPEALSGVLTRVLVAPAFLLHLEQAPAGQSPAPINDWELACRLSYFLWSSMPDAELRRAAETGRLHEPSMLARQTERMLKDERVRSLAIEFGTQWLHVRGFDELKEKNEKLFPTFDENLRKAIYEESILFFQDLFQHDRPVTRILDADDTFLNETLAKHYGIPGVFGPQWRKVEGIKKYGRGGILGLASVQAKEAGASRTSPVLRGNWVVETLLGEKLPRPPANVPQLPEEENGNDGLTVRQLVEKHAKAPECAVCHQRIDPFGFALESYDPIGRRREKDLGGLSVDTQARLKDGTTFEGIDGLRNYLLAKKKDVVVRLFCRRLLGYALGRAVALSDQPLLDQMLADIKKNEDSTDAAVLTIVKSRQFQMIRGRERGE